MLQTRPRCYRCGRSVENYSDTTAVSITVSRDIIATDTTVVSVTSTFFLRVTTVSLVDSISAQDCSKVEKTRL